MSVCSHFDLPVELISSLHASEHITRSGYNEKFAKGPIITFPVTSPDSGNTIPHRNGILCLPQLIIGLHGLWCWATSKHDHISLSVVVVDVVVLCCVVSFGGRLLLLRTLVLDCA